MKKRITVKVNVLVILMVIFCVLLIIIKLSYIVLSDTVDGISLSTLSSSITQVSKTLYGNRGSIYDINGEELATTVNSYTVVAYLSSSRTTDENNPQHVVDVASTAEALSPILGMSVERLTELLSKDAYQVELGPGGRGITEAVKAEIEALELPGIGFVSESKKRYYSKSTFAAYIVGYAKVSDDGEIVGELGIEGYYNDLLSGTNGYTTYLKYTSSNYQIPNTPSDTVEAEDGADIYLTIDSNIQLIAEKAVTTIEEDFSSEWAIVTVMDASTGAIVASATSPSFDPNDTNTITSYLNPLVSYTYEPGSVMKIFSFATAIEEGVYDGDETYASGTYTLSDGTIINDATKGLGTITFDAGFAYSSNVAATILALRLGTETLSNYYYDLGFGKKTGIELSNEVAGTVNIVYESELSNAAFGQGVSVTPIEMLQALSAITNDGTIIKPYVVEKIVDSSGNIVYEGGRTEVKKVYSKSTVSKIQQLMYDVIYNGGNGTIYQPSNVEVIGKTGTAQIASSKGGYLTGEYDYVKSFAGIFPADDPEYIIYVVAQKPVATSRAWGNMITTAIEEIASYAKLTNTESDVDESLLIELENYISTDVTTTVDVLEEKRLKLIVIGNGKYIINQYPLKKTTVLSGSKVYLVTNYTEAYMEDLTGWSLSEVKTYCSLLGIELEYSGYGYVTSQSIESGTTIDFTSVLSITLEK